MKEIMVSVVCTNYNKGDWIAEAIDSFLKQQADFKFEILVIDDNSSDHSPDLIRKYEKDHPGLVRAFYNDKNLGITKTWKKICSEASGKYIARCDGDDYWTDTQKLQKQVDALEADRKSKWCSTDYDVISPDGKLIHKSAFETHLVDRSDSYAQMLATKGFTMSSTWLIATDLMMEVNAELDETAVDDTFNIQLDLFNKTKLTYLPEATVVYRINEGSDSHPLEMNEVIARHQKLLNTQLQYIRKYKHVDYEKIIEFALTRDMGNEMLAIERLRMIYEQRNQLQIHETHIRDQQEYIEALKEELSGIRHSYQYRAGGILAAPVRALKRIRKNTNEK